MSRLVAGNLCLLKVVLTKVYSRSISNRSKLVCGSSGRTGDALPVIDRCILGGPENPARASLSGIVGDWKGMLCHLAVASPLQSPQITMVLQPLMLKTASPRQVASPGP
ncbi:hypothetical protein EI94DRAFT_1744857 [Lactarius quietus]|nr:hypothetical protein EI94DRAFT_1744857 [Lactarius quietus]